MGLAKTKPGVGRTCWVSLELSRVWPELSRVWAELSRFGLN